MENIAADIDKGMLKVIETGLQKQKKLDNDLVAIKEVCARFFDQYDSILDTVKISTHKMELQYENWAKVLIEPEANKVAKLHTLEYRAD